mmetsp:Transcript_40990/g.74922  ORF Transcript_40990/g.74922 Transcript_40990/m.74922 type:complete len:207 (+) Transcript_40990:411-1031(+)
MLKMMFIRLALIWYITAPAVYSVTVEQYDGPTTCDDSEKVKKGDQLKMHYTGTIDKSSKTGKPGSKFDSSRDHGETFDTQIGVGQVIPGWDKGIVGLCKGAKATLVIPPEEGYGDGGAGDDIPGGATLHFDVEVVDVAEGEPQENLFEKLDNDRDMKLSKEEVQAFFTEQGQEMPDSLFDEEDKDKDGFVSWDEFSGPKGDEKAEL